MAVSRQGPPGPPGATGQASTVPGPPGARGATGDPGERGTKVFKGHGAPGTVTGSQPGDHYVNLDDGTWWTLV